ncbi:MAG: exodeoxyribonuclease VII small subunit [Verrucomicrobiales bacterium]
MPRKDKAASKQDLRFEDAVERLENIIGRMETERIPLDDLLKDYEEGTRLLKLCRERIDNARTRVEEINKELDAGENALAPLDDNNAQTQEIEQENTKKNTPPGKNLNEGIQLL